MKSAESLLKQHLLDTRRHVRRLLFRIWGGGFFFVVVGFAIAWFFIQPAPPKRIVIATGPTDGAYFEFAQMYSDYLAPQGIELELRETAGTIENYELLLNDKDVDLAIVQGGVASEEFVENNALETLGSLFFEPVWVFYRADKSIADLRDLDDLRIAIGVKNSGTAAISELLLAQNGLGEEDGVEFVYLGGHQAADELIAGSVDAAIFVLSPKSELVSELVPREDIKLLDFSRADAYVRRYPFFTSLILERGVLDMEGDYPREDLHLIAPAANMVATESLHEALVPMMLKAATESHRHVTHYFEPGRLPSSHAISLGKSTSQCRCQCLALE